MQLRKLVKAIFHISHLDTIQFDIIKKYSIYCHNRKGKQFAYLLKQLDSHNFEKKQKQLLFNILKYAKNKVPYYHQIMNDVQLEKNQIFSNLKELPLLSKVIIREQGKNMYSEQFELLIKRWQNTGGSTGEPLKFPVSNNFEHVHQKFLFNLMGGEKNDIIVSIDGSRIKDELLNQHIYWKDGCNNFPWGSIHYSTLYMNDDNMKYYIDHLNLIKPGIMRGYPSGFEKLAKYLISNNISLEFDLKAIYLTSEFFDSSCTDLLRAGFKCSIYGQYGHSEVSIFAFTLANSLEYLCSPLYGFTEVLDEKGCHVKEGETGEVVVTGYSNKIMPVVRYKTGDLAEYGGIQNGIVKLKSLQGRSVDYVISDSNKKTYLTGLIFGGHLKSFEKIKNWQIEQNKPGKITVRIVKDTGYLDLHENEIVNLFDSVSVKADLEYVSEIPLTKRGKRKFMVQNIK